uniref:Neur_chan_LBD domain-containing protein n=1 Tax=Rhabditophanes sp. KR3021 TaxID=114890 RepID=A0AC35THB1_9BILA
MSVYNYLSLLFIIIIFNISKVKCNIHEEKLFRDLLEGVNPMERPVKNASESLPVKIRFFLQQIMDVDERNQVVQVNAWIRFIWTDYKLTWDPAKYDNITDIRFSGNLDQIWRPSDVMLYNSVDESFNTLYKSNLVVYSNGEIQWVPPSILKFSCKMDITWFPFDSQICHLKFGIWTYHGDDLDLQIDTGDPNSIHQMDLSDYVVNGEWILASTPAKREVQFYSCCPEPYITIVFALHIQRRVLYYGFNLIIPSLLITILSIFGFSLAPDAGEKINLRESMVIIYVIK